MCVTIIIEIFGTHLNFFLENEPALYGFTGAKTGSNFRFLFLLEHVRACIMVSEMPYSLILSLCNKCLVHHAVYCIYVLVLSHVLCMQSL